jgi:ribose transport system substrate-binding protein
VPILQTLLAEHPSALIVTPDDPVALKAPIESFIQAGIPVITVDTELADSSIVTSQITSDGYQGGTLAADATAKSCGDKGTVFVMEADTTTTTLVLRGNGFLTEMKKYPGITVLPVQYDHHSIPTASSIASALLTSHPDICGIFATNNTAAEGISSALLEAGLSGKVFLVGFDAGPTEVSLLKGGTISELIIQQPALEATTAVQYAYDYLTGQKSKIQHTVELKNVVATHADANSPSIEKYYYTG